MYFYFIIIIFCYSCYEGKGNTVATSEAEKEQAEQASSRTNLGNPNFSQKSMRFILDKQY